MSAEIPISWRTQFRTLQHFLFLPIPAHRSPPHPPHPTRGCSDFRRPEDPRQAVGADLLQIFHWFPGRANRKHTSSECSSRHTRSKTRVRERSSMTVGCQIWNEASLCNHMCNTACKGWEAVPNWCRNHKHKDRSNNRRFDQDLRLSGPVRCCRSVDSCRI